MRSNGTVDEHYVAVYMPRADVGDSRRTQLPGMDGDIGYSRAEQMNRAVLRSQLEATADTRGPMC